MDSTNGSLNSIPISNEIQPILEIIAEAVHEQWRIERITDGWSFGSVRDDKLKQTPCLVPYDKLPEQEKKYDRNTAKAVITSLLREGFSIKKEQLT